MPGFSRAALSEAARRLAAAGCVFAEEEAGELAQVAVDDESRLSAMVERRSTGEPLAWITGTAEFCGCSLLIAPGVFVPRTQSEPLARRAAELLPENGRAIDLGTGCGAIARALLDARPNASILGTESDPTAARCARRNGITVAEGDLFEAVPESWKGTIDLVIAVLPYVPTDELVYLPRDVRAFEPPSALDGGPDGLVVLRRAVGQASEWLRDGGHLLVEIGGDQSGSLIPFLEASRFEFDRILVDEDGDRRGIEATAVASLPRPASNPWRKPDQFQ